MTQNTITVDDDLLGSMKIPLPDGFRHVPLDEYVERLRLCEDMDNEDLEDAWDDLDEVYLWDHEDQQLLSISSMPYRWRIFVERIDG